MFVPDAERHEPAGHAVHAPAPDALKKPAAHARPTPVSVVDDAVCETLTVPVHAPVVHGLGESVTTVVPTVTPAPAMTMPRPSEPDVTAEMASAVDAAPMAPVTTGAMKPAAQKAPAGHGPEHAGAERLVAAPYVPAGHGTGVTEPSGQKEPRGHAAVHVLAERPVVAPYVPAGHAVGALAAAGQYEPAGHGTCVVLAVVGYGQKEPAAHWFAVAEPLLSARQLPAAHTVGRLTPAPHQ
jgi:hypothetical protein